MTGLKSSKLKGNNVIQGNNVNLIINPYFVSMEIDWF